LILAQNAETRDWFPGQHRPKTRVFHNAVIREELIGVPGQPARSGAPSAIYAGRLEPFKGVFLCLHALARLPEWRLVICGAGNDESRMRLLARRLGVEDQIEWLGWLPQSEVLSRMREADVFLFPSLHEEAGVAVAEARAAGLPIVCLARGGPPLLAGPGGTCVADSGDVHAVAGRLADAALTSLPWRREQKGPHADEVHALSLDSRAAALQKLLAETLDLP
jgi:glycosyltransferase involved in cell wall biosynthesis